jgi:hypothetical protein
MTRVALLPTFLWFSVVLLGTAGTAHAQAEHVFDTPLALALTNPCNGEPVAIAGTVNLLIRTSQDNAGGVHIGLQIASKGEGVGIQNTYVYSNVQDEESYISDHTQTFTQTINQVLISTTGAPNFLMKFTLHTTIANDAVTAEVDHAVVECKG